MTHIKILLIHYSYSAIYIWELHGFNLNNCSFIASPVINGLKSRFTKPAHATIRIQNKSNNSEPPLFLLIQCYLSTLIVLWYPTTPL